MDVKHVVVVVEDEDDDVMIGANAWRVVKVDKVRSRWRNDFIISSLDYVSEVLEIASCDVIIIILIKR